MTAIWIGVLATAVNLGDGGSSDVWAPEVVTVADGLRSALNGGRLTIDDGNDPASASALAAASDVAQPLSANSTKTNAVRTR